jgi:hypothetical protein
LRRLRRQQLKNQFSKNLLVFLFRLQIDMSNPAFLRRDAAAEYLKNRYGFGSARTLAKGLVTGDTPDYRKCGRLVLYEQEALDRWALVKISAPRRSSSDEGSER